ncbi:mitochondrial carrier domain-containing protein [Globomyces pollinis-pini]|nr:mitochondrial carrier domain-containing protein [Globomyces pollinis-pini]
MESNSLNSSIHPQPKNILLPITELDVKVPPSKLAELLFGSVAGLTGKVVEHPFDTLKVHLQTQNKMNAIGILQNIIKTDGLRGLYAGISAPIIGSMMETAILFFSYSEIQKQIRSFSGLTECQPLSLAQLCLSGGNKGQKFMLGIAGCFGATLLTPIELLKCRQQTHGYLSVSQLSHRKGIASMFVDTLRQEGIAGLYKGHTGTLVREGFGGAVWFGLYEYSIATMIKRSKLKITKEDLSPLQLMFAGSIAGVGFHATFFPADVIKTRIQSGLHGGDGFLKATRRLYKSHGMKGFYRGYGITIVRGAGASAVIFLTYEWLCRNIRI